MNKVSTENISIEKIVSLLVQVRNQHIGEFLKSDEAVMAFLEKRYNTLAISKIRLEFLKRDLKELQQSSLDLVHFSSLIKELKKEFSESILTDHPLFASELDVIFKKNGVSINK